MLTQIGGQSELIERLLIIFDYVDWLNHRIPLLKNRQVLNHLWGTSPGRRVR
jgi:hypothetical protein